MKTKFSATSVDQTLDSKMLILVSPKPIPHSKLLSQSKNNETISSSPAYEGVEKAKT
jgi:hypothetical protein